MKVAYVLSQISKYLRTKSVQRMKGETVTDRKTLAFIKLVGIVGITSTFSLLISMNFHLSVFYFYIRPVDFWLQRGRENVRGLRSCSPELSLGHTGCIYIKRWFSQIIIDNTVRYSKVRIIIIFAPHYSRHLGRSFSIVRTPFNFSDGFDAIFKFWT